MFPTGQLILYESSEHIARITLNRPEKRNALNDELIAQFKQALRRADQDNDVSAIIISGAGEDFCAGADLEALQKISTASIEENLEDARALMDLFLLIRLVRPPVIAAVAGRALAGGCGLALACDMVIANGSAEFGFPEVRIGFVPAMVLAILRRNVSEKKAFELITLGRSISGFEAAALGLINHALDAAELQSHARSLAESFTRLSQSALALSKCLLYKTDGLSFSEALASGVDVNVVARMSKDYRAGIEKFLKRR